MRTYITILHETVRVLVNFKHRIGYRYRLISALKISVIGTSAKSHIGASLLISSPPFIAPCRHPSTWDIPSHNQLLEAQVNELARIGQTEQPPQQIPQIGSGQSGSGEKLTDKPDPLTSLTLGKGLPSLSKKLLG